MKPEALELLHLCLCSGGIPTMSEHLANQGVDLSPIRPSRLLPGPGQSQQDTGLQHTQRAMTTHNMEAAQQLLGNDMSQNMVRVLCLMYGRW